MNSNNLNLLSIPYLHYTETEFYEKINEFIEQIEQILLQSNFYKDYIKKLKINSQKYNPYKSIKKIIINKKSLNNYLKKRITLSASINHILIDGIRVLLI